MKNYVLNSHEEEQKRKGYELISSETLGELFGRGHEAINNIEEVIQRMEIQFNSDSSDQIPQEFEEMLGDATVFAVDLHTGTQVALNFSEEEKNR